LQLANLLIPINVNIRQEDNLKKTSTVQFVRIHWGIKKPLGHEVSEGFFSLAKGCYSKEYFAFTYHCPPFIANGPDSGYS